MAAKVRKGPTTKMKMDKFWYTIPYRATRIEGQMMTWDKALFSSPCMCCGSERHAVLHHKLNRLGEYEDAEFSCPILQWNEVDGMIDESRMSQKYAPDPRKIATMCLRKETDVKKILEGIEKEGARRYMHTNQWDEIQREARRLVDNKGVQTHEELRCKPRQWVK